MSSRKVLVANVLPLLIGLPQGLCGRGGRCALPMIRLGLLARSILLHSSQPKTPAHGLVRLLRDGWCWSCVPSPRSNISCRPAQSQIDPLLQTTRSQHVCWHCRQIAAGGACSAAMHQGKQGSAARCLGKSIWLLAGSEARRRKLSIYGGCKAFGEAIKSKVSILLVRLHAMLLASC